MADTKRTITRGINPSSTEWQNPASNPAQANADIASVLASVNSDIPEIDFPSGDVVNLPGGIIMKDIIIKEVQVRELTGEDEESLARASQSSNRFTFLDRLLKCGTVRVGNQSVEDIDSLLDSMLIGDREAVILGIREATYGDKIDVDGWQCSNCGKKDNLELNISDIPITKLDNPSQSTFQVPMRKGGYALVKLATGADQLATFDKADLTLAQYQSVLLSKCIVSITDSNEVCRYTTSFPSLVLNMSMPDRHSVLRELDSRQPGPKYDQIKHVCNSCNEKVNVVVSIGNLFLDLGWV